MRRLGGPMRRLGLILWAGLTLGSLVWMLGRFGGVPPVETDILAMLPQQPATAEAHWIAEAKERLAETVSERATFVIGAREFATAKQTAEALRGGLRSAHLIEDQLDEQPPLRPTDFGRFMFAHRSGLLSPGDRAALLSGDVKAIVARLRAPLSGRTEAVQAVDPFQLFPAFMASLPLGRAGMTVRDGLPTVEERGKIYVMMTVRLAGNPFSQDFQTLFVPRVDALVNAAERTPGVDVLHSGEVFRAYESARQARSESSLIGGISAVAMVLCLLALFRGLQPLALGALAVASGLVVGVAAGVAAFGRLHAVSLVFAASLIGISIDYAFHYFCERYNPVADTPAERARRIVPGLTLGMASSVVGFGALAFTPFAGLRHMAVICAVGLAVSYLCVVCVFPVLDRGKPLPADDALARGAMAASGGLRALWYERKYRRILAVVGALLAVLSLLGTSELRSVDDIRRFQAPMPEVWEQEGEILRLTGQDDAMRAYLIVGSSEEDVLRREEALAAQLEVLRARGGIGGYVALSRIVPSQQRQAENRALVASRLAGPYRDAALAAGGSAMTEETQPLDVGALLESGALPLARTLRLSQTPGEVVQMMPLIGVVDVPAVAALAEDESVFLVDHERDISQSLAANRSLALRLLATSVAMIGLVLAARYDFRRAMRVAGVPVIAALAAPPLAALFGAAFTFFSVMGMILIFAIGLDYALFCAESGARQSGDEDLRRITLANGLSALSTMMAFGLLSLSSMPVVHSFGLTALIGILLAFVLSPVAEPIPPWQAKAAPARKAGDADA